MTSKMDNELNIDVRAFSLTHCSYLKITRQIYKNPNKMAIGVAVCIAIENAILMSIAEFCRYCAGPSLYINTITGYGLSIAIRRNVPLRPSIKNVVASIRRVFAVTPHSLIYGLALVYLSLARRYMRLLRILRQI